VLHSSCRNEPWKFLSWTRGPAVLSVMD
jgi:hypothetical protein